MRSVGCRPCQPGPAGVHGDLYAAGLAYAHKLFLHAGHALFGRHAVCRARRRGLAFVLGLQRHHARFGHRALRRLFAVLGRHAASGAAVPVAVQHYDRQLERHELSHGHQGLPRHSVQLCRGHWRGMPMRPGRAGAGAAARRRRVGVNRPGLRCDARLGRGAAVPVFSSERSQPLALFALARPVYAAGTHGPVYQPGTLCTSGNYLGRPHWRAGQGPVLRRTLPRCAGAHRVFDDPCHDRQLCSVGRGQLLSALPRLLQPV